MAAVEAADPTAGSGGGALGAIDRAVHRVEKLTALLSGFGVFALMMIGVAQILSRKIINWPIYGYIDIVEIMMSFLVFMGLAYTERLGGHIRMELILTFLPKRLVNAFEILGVLLGLFVVGVLTYYTGTHALRSYTSGDSTMDAQIALWPSKLVVSLSLALLFVRLLIELWGYARLVASPEATPYGVPQLLDVEEMARRDAAIAEELVHNAQEAKR
jgi:TRAP-type C4-dicarboxylate transport system permease small subunit